MPGEPFKKLKHLGTGGCAETWLVTVIDEAISREFGVSQCVIKIPLDPEKELVLKHEVEIDSIVHQQLKELKSANIVRYLGFTAFEGRIVMAMEYAPDGDLRQKIGKIDYQRRLPLTEALDITEGILEALVLIHNQSIIHRDIKPENIMFDGCVAKLCDLGTARLLKAEELAYARIGTLLYMPPEIHDEKGATFTADIWSLGVCLYEMLTGELPFGGRAVYDIVRDVGIKVLKELICHAGYKKALNVCPDIPKEVSSLIDKALEKDPSRRFQSAAEMLRVLRLHQEASKDPPGIEIAAIREQMSIPGQTAAVEARLRRLIRLFPDDVRIYRYLGELYNRCQRYPEAIDTFKKGIELAPEDADLYWNLFLSHHKNRQPHDAEAALVKATQLGLDASLQRYGGMLLKAS